MSRRLVAGVCGLAAAVVMLVAVFLLFGPARTGGAKKYTLTVVDDAGAEKVYEGQTDKVYLRGLLDELQETEDFSYSGSDGAFGIYIKTVNGLTADYNEDHAYWAIYVNGGYGQFGADRQPVNDGDSFRLVYEDGR